MQSHFQAAARARPLSAAVALPGLQTRRPRLPRRVPSPEAACLRRSLPALAVQRRTCAPRRRGQLCPSLPSRPRQLTCGQRNPSCGTAKAPAHVPARSVSRQGPVRPHSEIIWGVVLDGKGRQVKEDGETLNCRHLSTNCLEPGANCVHTDLAKAPPLAGPLAFSHTRAMQTGARGAGAGVGVRRGSEPGSRFPQAAHGKECGRLPSSWRIPFP